MEKVTAIVFGVMWVYVGITLLVNAIKIERN
jgi:hypothetical protein